ncbi:hypothetical protein VYU27_010475, partial [Nannochloropsis oceanica]
TGSRLLFRDYHALASADPLLQSPFAAASSTSSPRPSSSFTAASMTPQKPPPGKSKARTPTR